jgi:hypothetical protein
MEKTFTFSGNVRRNFGGQIIVDLCESDLDHHRHSVTDAEQNRPLCRKTVESCFDDLIGRAGALTVTVSFEENSQGAVPQTEVHTAETVKQKVAAVGAMEEAVIAALEQLDGN